MKRLSIPARLTIMTVVLLTLCCTALTLVLNRSAYRLALQALQEPVLQQAAGMQAVETVPSQLMSEAETKEIPAAVIGMTAVVASQPARTYRIDSFLGMAAFVLLGGALMYLAIHRALRPLQTVSAHMKHTTAANLSATLPLPKRQDEVYTLTSAFNEMTQKLENAFAAQKRFSANAAHELRTPLTAMRTSLEVFGKTAVHTPQEYDKLFATLQAQTGRLSELVSSLLKFTNLEQIDRTQTVELDGLVALACEEIEPAARQKDIGVHCSLPPQPLAVAGNAELLYQAFYNLLENAVRYNTGGGRVTVSAQTETGRHTVRIADTGIGIPPQYRAAVFEPFYTVDPSRSRQNGGAGIGLSLVHSIVTQHAGTVTIEENPGGGTVFVVALPQARP